MAESSPFRYRRSEDSAGFLLWKVTVLWQSALSGVLSELGITQTQYAILASLLWLEEHHETTTQTGLVEHTRIDKMTLSKAIRRLEARRLILRKRSSSDLRAQNIRFSARGRRLIGKAIVAIEDADERFFSCLNESQLKTYRTLTSRVIAGT